MPKQAKWIKYDVTMIDNNRECWVFLTWFLSVAKQFDYGVVPHRLVDSEAFILSTGFNIEQAKSQFRSALVGSFVIYCSISAPTPGRGSGSRVVEGWRHCNWDGLMPDSRVVKRPVRPLPMPNFLFYRREGSTDAGKVSLSIVDVVEKCIECMTVGGNRTRVISLDAISMDIVQKLVVEHGVEAVHSALDKCGGASRPAYMLKKVMSGKASFSRSSVPSREEWLKG